MLSLPECRRERSLERIVRIVAGQHGLADAPEQYETHAGFSYQVGSFGTHRASLDGRWRREPTGFVLGATAFLDVAENDYRVDVQIPDERGRLFAATVPRSHDGYDAYGVIQQPELGSG